MNDWLYHNTPNSLYRMNHGSCSTQLSSPRISLFSQKLQFKEQDYPIIRHSIRHWNLWLFFMPIEQNLRYEMKSFRDESFHSMSLHGSQNLNGTLYSWNASRSSESWLLARVIFQEITTRHLRMSKEMEERNKVYGIVFVVGYIDGISYIKMYVVSYGKMHAAYFKCVVD